MLRDLHAEQPDNFAFAPDNLTLAQVAANRLPSKVAITDMRANKMAQVFQGFANTGEDL